MDMPDNDLPRLDIDSVMPYDCIRLKSMRWLNNPRNIITATSTEYDKWHYNYPKYDETYGFVKVPSQNFSAAMVEAFKDKLK